MFDVENLKIVEKAGVLICLSSNILQRRYTNTYTNCFLSSFYKIKIKLIEFPVKCTIDNAII